MPPGAEAVLIVGLPLAILAFLFALPFARPFGQRHPMRRPLAIVAVALFVGGYAAFTAAGVESFWVPLRVEGASLPPAVTDTLQGRAREGAGLFVERSCWSCHMVDGSGGRRGPDLTHVAARLDHDSLVARIANGGPGMPGYAAALQADDVERLVAFLLTRR